MAANRKRKVQTPAQRPGDSSHHRPSGVRRTAEAAAPDARWLTAASQVPVDEVLRLFAEGNDEAAVACGESFFERSYVPVMAAGPRDLRDATLDMRARWLVPFIDGESPLPRVLESSALPAADALHAICVLLEQKLVVLR